MIRQLALLFAVSALLLSCGGAVTHWKLGGDGVIRPVVDSDYTLREPGNLAALVEQERDVARLRELEDEMKLVDRRDRPAYFEKLKSDMLLTRRRVEGRKNGGESRSAAERREGLLKEEKNNYDEEDDDEYEYIDDYDDQCDDDDEYDCGSESPL